MVSISQSKGLTYSKIIDEIEKFVYVHLKPLGFRKYGKDLHRFVDGDISQVINFQCGRPYNILWINLGIRVPECKEKTFSDDKPMKKYYHEYECNIRTRLGGFVDGTDTYYDLREDPQKIAEDILERLTKYVMPVFDTLNSRDAILKHRRDYVDFDSMCHEVILFDEAMIFRRKGDFQKAEQLFNQYYEKVLSDYLKRFESGTQWYLHKGESITYNNTKTKQTETIVAEKDGYVTLYDANRNPLNNLEDLAKKLDITIYSLENKK